MGFDEFWPALMAPEDAIAIVVYVCLGLACTSVSLRTVVRYRWLDVGMRVEDWLMIVALVSSMILPQIVSRLPRTRSIAISV